MSLHNIGELLKKLQDIRAQKPAAVTSPKSTVPNRCLDGYRVRTRYPRPG
jgi:hypothetical protein